MATQNWSPLKISTMAQIYGIDLSQEKFDVNFRDKNGSLKGFIANNTLNGIEKFLDNFDPQDILCAEHTGVYGELLVCLASLRNLKIALVSGYQVKHSLGLKRGKSDKIDAEKIREYAERFTDKLRFLNLESEELKELREIYSLRAILVQQRKMLLAKRKGKAYLPSNSILVNQVTRDVILTMDEKIDKLEKEIVQLIKSSKALWNSYEIVTSVIGIGKVTACELIIKTGNFKRISTARTAASYAGVCPFPNSSGRMVKKSKVSPLADKSLKSLLFMCSRIAVKYNKEYKLYFSKKAIDKKQYYLIMNNVANKLLRTIYALIESGQRFDPNYICLDPREKIKKVV
jgi:transposase